MFVLSTPAEAACSITADTPYANNNYVWTGGYWSGCAAPVQVDVKWSRVGPDGTIGVKPNAANYVDYGWGNWGSPQSCTLYGKAFDNNGVDEDSSLRTFTSATTDCLL